jgi:hypothetical protein
VNEDGERGEEDGEEEHGGRRSTGEMASATRDDGEVENEGKKQSNERRKEEQSVANLMER